MPGGVINFIERSVRLTIQIGYSRLLPGILNFAALLLVIKLLGDKSYAVFSVGFGYVSLLIQVVYGWLLHGLVPSMSLQKIDAKVRSGVLTYIFGIILISTILFVPFNYIDSTLVVYLLLFVVYGTDLTILELIRSDQNYRLYALSSFARSITILLGTGVLFINNLISISSIILIYALGSAVSISVAAFLDKRFRFKCAFDTISRESIGQIFHAGLKGNLINILDNGVVTVLKNIALVVLGSSAAGQFSSVIDITKRLIGVVFNLSAFVGLPSAYLKFDKVDIGNFKEELKFLLYYSFIGVAAVLSVLIVSDYLGVDIIGYSFQNDVLIYTLLTLSIIVQRVRKMICDPIILVLSSIKQLSFVSFILILAPLSLVFVFGITSLEVLSLQYFIYSLVVLLAYVLISRESVKRGDP